MAFDLSTAKPEQAQAAQQPQAPKGGFDISTAKIEAPQGQAVTKDQDQSLGESILGGISGAATLASSAVGAAIGTADVLVDLLNPFTDNPPEVAKKVISDAIEAFKISPTKGGELAVKKLSETLEPIVGPVGDFIDRAAQQGMDLTGSNSVGTFLTILPDVIGFSTGAGAIKGSLTSPTAKGVLPPIDRAAEIKRLKNIDEKKIDPEVARAIQEAAPDLKSIKDKASNLYKEIDESGVRIKPKVYENFANKLSDRLKKEGIDKTLHPKASAALKRINENIGSTSKLSEIETLRKIAKDAAGSIDKSDARLGTIMVNQIDNAMDSISSSIGGKSKEARALSQRAFKSQAITDMIDRASNTASGLENGLRIEARKLLNNKKKMRGFTKDEKASLKTVVDGTSKANAAKFLGKFGISEGQATSMLGASIGAGGGGVIGSVFGPVGAGVGAIAVPAIAQIAKKTAQRITKNNSEFADALVRSGKDARAIATEYLKHTPKKDRNVSDLTDLLIGSNVKKKDIKFLSKSKTPKDKLISDSLFFAENIKDKIKKSGGAASITAASTTIEDKK